MMHTRQSDMMQISSFGYDARQAARPRHGMINLSIRFLYVHYAIGSYILAFGF